MPTKFLSASRVVDFIVLGAATSARAVVSSLCVWERGDEWVEPFGWKGGRPGAPHRRRGESL